MKKTLLFVLALVLLVGCGDSVTTPAPPPEPVLNTTAHSERDAAWTDEIVTASAISWRFLDLQSISYQLTWTNNDPSRAVTVNWSLHFVDRAGFKIFESPGTSRIIPAASSRYVQDIVSTFSYPDWITLDLDLANTISNMDLWASFTFD